MKGTNKHRFVRKQKIHSNLVWVSEWCDKNAYLALKKDQNYSHGICTFHKNELILKYHFSSSP